MKETFFQKFGKSVSCFDFYKKQKKTTIKSGIKYLTILILIFSIITVGQFVYSMLGLYDLNIPEVRIVNGNVETDVEQPYVINEEEGNLFVIDSTGKYTNLDNYKRGAILMDNKIIIKNSKYEIREIDISNIESFNANKETINKMIFWGITIVSVFIMILLYLGLSIYSLFFGLIGLLIAKTMKTKLTFQQTWIYAVYALTPVLLFGFILDLVHVGFPFRNSIIYLTYLIGAISKK